MSVTTRRSRRRRLGWGRGSVVARLALVVAVVAAVTLHPSAALAHATVVSSQPEAGQRLGSAPGVVVLRFTQPLNTRLSGAVVTDPTGRRFRGTAGAEREIRVPLATNAPGVYRVEWTSVSTLDGHTLRGSFRFGVGVSPGEGAEGTVGVAPQRSDVLIGVGRSVEDGALLLAIGSLLMRRIGRREPPLLWVHPPIRLALGVALLGGLGVVVGEALAAASPAVGAVASYLTTGLPGVARTSRLVAEIVALVAFILGRGVGLPVVAAVVALAAAGHAAASPPVGWAIAVQATHVLATGLWAGGILALAIMRPPGGWRGPQARTLLAGSHPSPSPPS